MLDVYLQMARTDVNLESNLAIFTQWSLYQLWFVIYGTRIFRRARRFMKYYGTLNEEKRGRDMIADVHRDRLDLALALFLVVS